jgi:ubiquinone/menaquinone biosynthesis C-methylase UbiE
MSPHYANLEPILRLHSPDKYYEYILQYGPQVFVQRVDMAGVSDCENVLDAGCGYGQWAVALSDANRHVTAFDRDVGMVEIAKAFASHYGRSNISVSQHDLNNALPFADETFDAVWCWGVIMFVDRELALREFHRVLKPGGKLFLGAVNSHGRWLLKLCHSLNPFQPNLPVAKMSVHALIHGKQPDAFPSLMSTGSAARLLDRYGFTVTQARIDGHIDVKGKRKLSIFPPRFIGLEANIEVLASKR